MARIKRCACGCINDVHEAICRNCGIDILFDTTESIPDEEYEKLMQSQNGASEPANSSRARVPENSGDAPSSPSGAESAASNGVDFVGVFDAQLQSSEHHRTPGTGRIVLTPANPQPRPQLFKFCKCGEVNSPDRQICSRCANSLEEVAAMTRQAHEKMLEDLKKVQPVAPANVHGKYLRSIDNECVIQPKTTGEKLLIGRNAADKNVRDFLESRMGVSRNHANVWYDENNLFIEDMGSTNGTFINNCRIENNKSYVLKPGDQVSLGNPNGKAKNIVIFRVN